MAAIPALSQSLSAGGSERWAVASSLCVSAARGSARSASRESVSGMGVYVGTTLNMAKPRLMTTKETMYRPENWVPDRKGNQVS